MGSVAKLGGSGMIVYSWDIALALNTLLSYPKMNYCDRPIHFRSQLKANALHIDCSTERFCAVNSAKLH